MRERKNKDWALVWSKESTREDIELFNNECGVDTIKLGATHYSTGYESIMFDRVFLMPYEEDAAMEYIKEEVVSEKGWYVFGNHLRSFYYANGVDDNYYGLISGGVWSQKDYLELTVKASEKDVLDALTEYAKAKGFVTWASFKSIVNKGIRCVEKEHFYCLDNGDLLVCSDVSSFYIMKDGVWAELLDKEEKEEKGVLSKEDILELTLRFGDACNKLFPEKKDDLSDIFASIASKVGKRAEEEMLKKLEDHKDRAIQEKKEYKRSFSVDVPVNIECPCSSPPSSFPPLECRNPFSPPIFQIPSVEEVAIEWLLYKKQNKIFSRKTSDSAIILS